MVTFGFELRQLGIVEQAATFGFEWTAFDIVKLSGQFRLVPDIFDF